MAEQPRHSWDPPAYASEPSEEESDSDVDPTFETTVAAPYLGLDPFETADQDDYMEVRAEVSANSRTEELYDKWVETVERLYPNDKPRRDRLIAAFLKEQHEEKLLLQTVDQDQKEETGSNEQAERLEAREPRS